jgi:hypothetical protein
MKTTRTLLVAGGLGAIVLSAPSASAAALIVIDPTGTVHIQQGLPCGGTLDLTRPIAGGRIEVAPAATGGAITLDLTRLELFFAPFSVRGACQGIEAITEFSEIGVRLAGAVIVTGEPIGDVEGGALRFAIPKEQFLIYESVRDNAPVRQPESAYRRPSEDVTGVIDPRRGIVEIHVVLTARVRFRAGCVGDRCLIDEVQPGTQTTDVVGPIVPPSRDRDGDGVPDVSDNCPLTPNPTQALVATPVITAPPDITLNSCLDRDIGAARATDVCHARPVYLSNNVPARFAAGPNLVTWRGNDGVDPIVTAQQTVTIVDTTPPTVSCTPTRPPGRSFRVSAADDCGAPIVRLGRFTLGNGEVIQIQETGEPGVRLIGTIGPDRIRHFQVGKGEDIITATDGANVVSAACR